MTLKGFHACETCSGAGTVTHPGSTEREWLEGLREHRCPSCSGLGVVPDPAWVETVAEGIRDDFDDDPTWWIEEAMRMARAALLTYARKAKEQT